MRTHGVDGVMLRRYLLGQTDETESERIERDYLAQAEAVDAIDEVEQALIEEYLEGRCPPDVRQRFETHYLASPVHARRVSMIRALQSRGAVSKRGRRFVVPLTLAATLVLGLSAGLLYLNPPGRRGTITLVVPAVATRGEGAAPTLELGDGSSPVELRLERLAADGAPPFRAVVRTVEGDELWQGPATAGEPEVFVVLIPAGALRPGDHIVTVLGSQASQPLQRYYFRATGP